MLKREIPSLGVTVSRLGFGAMRMPERDGKIERVEATRMIAHMFEAGVTYFDTAYPYHNGESEEMLAGALRRFPREREGASAGVREKTRRGGKRERADVPPGCVRTKRSCGSMTSR